MRFSFKSILSKLPETNRFERIWKLAQVDFKKRYYNDKFGLLWALINPILQVSVYFLAFNYFLGRSKPGVDNFALYLFSGIIFWMEFSMVVKKSTKILYQKRYLIENIQLDKIDLYLSIALSSALGLSFNITAYLIAAFFMGIEFSLNSFLYLPIVILILYAAALGTGMICSILYIYFRDIVHLIDVSLLIGFWTSGIIFPIDKIVEMYKPIYYMHPFLGLFSNIRSILLSNSNIDIITLSLNLLFALVVLGIGFSLVNKYSQYALEKL